MDLLAIVLPAAFENNNLCKIWGDVVNRVYEGFENRELF